MTSIAIICAALAVFAFCAMHAVAEIIGYRKATEAKRELEQVKKDLENEIRNNGNVARIAQLRARMFELEDRIK